MSTETWSAASDVAERRWARETAEAEVVYQVIDTVLAILENGTAVAGGNWEFKGIASERTDQLYARFRAVRDDLADYRALKARPQAVVGDGAKS